MNEGKQPCWRPSASPGVGIKGITWAHAPSWQPSAGPGRAARPPSEGSRRRPLGMLSSGGGRGSRSRKLAAAAAVQAALTRARQRRGLEDGGRGRGRGRWSRRRRQGPRERGAPPPLQPLVGWVPSAGLLRGRWPRWQSSGSSAESWAGERPRLRGGMGSLPGPQRAPAAGTPGPPHGQA